MWNNSSFQSAQELLGECSPFLQAKKCGPDKNGVGLRSARQSAGGLEELGAHALKRAAWYQWWRGQFGRLLPLPLELPNSLFIAHKIAQLLNAASVDHYSWVGSSLGKSCVVWRPLGREQRDLILYAGYPASWYWYGCGEGTQSLVFQQLMLLKNLSRTT